MLSRRLSNSNEGGARFDGGMPRNPRTDLLQGCVRGGLGDHMSRRHADSGLWDTSNDLPSLLSLETSEQGGEVYMPLGNCTHHWKMISVTWVTIAYLSGGKGFCGRCT